jgi:hypothetical protein
VIKSSPMGAVRGMSTSSPNLGGSIPHHHHEQVPTLETQVERDQWRKELAQNVDQLNQQLDKHRNVA